MKSYKIYWLDGSTEIIKGTSIENALSEAGYNAYYCEEICDFEEIEAR